MIEAVSKYNNAFLSRKMYKFDFFFFNGEREINVFYPVRNNSQNYDGRILTIVSTFIPLCNTTNEKERNLAMCQINHEYVGETYDSTIHRVRLQ